jgi:hypothetical protein
MRIHCGDLTGYSELSALTPPASHFEQGPGPILFSIERFRKLRGFQVRPLRSGGMTISGACPRVGLIVRAAQIASANATRQGHDPGNQSQDREGAWPHCPAIAARPRR